MDFVEINKMTQDKRVRSARQHLYDFDKITNVESVILVTYACKKLYGIRNTAKIIHSLGIDRIKCDL